MKQVASALLLLVLLCDFAQAELTIEVTRGVDEPVPIAVVPFGWSGGVPREDVAGIVAADLHRSGQFQPLPSEDMLSMPNRSQEVHYRDWRSLAVDYVLVGRVQASADKRLAATFELMDVHAQKVILEGTESGSPDQLRDIAHAISNRVYEKLTNIKGAFDTKLLYVSAIRGPNREPVYRLLLSDIDGAREKVLLEQKEPIMTPSWSPNGRIVSYVSFETSRPAIFMHNLATNQRMQLTGFSGINGSPAWSPDGRRMAMVLSKDGNPEIYVMDLESRALQRVTNHFAIDTEPDWTPDGRAIIFTSDRGGKPQIYKVTLATGHIERLTFRGNYNARARMLPGGEGMIMVHRDNGDFHIALQEFKSGRIISLTETQLDESPSIAPNGTILLYATKRGGKGVLAAVSVDGDVQYYLPSKFGDVREPAWSPFLDQR